MKDCKIAWKINVRELKIKLYLEILILLWIKWPGMVEIKQKKLWMSFHRPRIYRVYRNMKIAKNTKLIP